jgi:hypothetical protein
VLHVYLSYIHLTFLYQMPLATPFPGPLSVLVMDNARIHHGEEILELAEHFGMYLMTISHFY